MLRSGDFQTDLAWAAAAGAQGIGLDLASVPDDATGYVEAAHAAQGVRISSVVADPTVEYSRGPDYTRSAERALRRCAELGAPGMMAMVGELGDRSYADADRAVIAALRQLGPLATSLGVRVMIEPVHPLVSYVGFVHTLRHALDLVGDIPGAGIVVDVGQLYWDRHFYDDLAAAGSAIATVQISDVDRAALLDYSYRRCQLGQGVVPVADMMLAIDASGYSGFYEFESARRLPRSERVGYVREGAEWFDSVWSSAGRPSGRSSGAPGDRSVL